MRQLDHLLPQAWPGDRHTLLLRAGLLDGARAVDAWEKFLTLFGLDDLDEGEFRLLPLVAKNLLRAGFEGPSLVHLKSVRRQAWYRNQMVLHRLAPVVRKLQEAGIPAMIVKGAPLAYTCYEDAGLRPMRDLDIVVPEAYVDRAADLLLEAGWTTIPAGYEKTLRSPLRGYRHSVAFRDRSGDEVDLHWHIFYRARSGAIDEELWQGAVTMNFQGISTRTLAPTHHLMLIVIHGCEAFDVPSLRWTADAMMLLRQHPAIDWDWIEAFSVKQRLTLPSLAVFTYLAGQFEAPVPAGFLDALRRAPRNRSDIAEFDRMTRPLQLQTVGDTIRAKYREHIRGCGDLSGWRQYLGFPAYLAWDWQVNSIAALGRKVLAWSNRRVRRHSVGPVNPA